MPALSFPKRFVIRRKFKNLLGSSTCIHVWTARSVRVDPTMLPWLFAAAENNTSASQGSTIFTARAKKSRFDPHHKDALYGPAGSLLVKCRRPRRQSTVMAGHNRQPPASLKGNNLRCQRDTGPVKLIEEEIIKSLVGE